ncbi:hypothetical protein FPF71_10145 [Algibacter amylolyticus]|uniref:Disease resistance R13L4/SHOC-2-like LRR domain-containing protein n=1 Tax=Algibacter amylolyticus TaxID=1608400 RepID=A0A5M7B4S6_9FLAO|nr:hypothetical protein [Algibacter amylolyticus]KAA5824526.1 hypothetical protein F2B50_10145 [Algibacter amylolyticus]MBB5269407.1 hypothetical protein [Algibacter amylolyticus]TSJ75299.1 hypothetical protein FPF71_10145 [Algibacter amylolyticus]
MRKLILVLILSFLLNSCSKDESNKDKPEVEQQTEIKENTVVINDENSNIVSTEEDLSNGVYIIEFSGDLPEIFENNIIIGSEGEGFLRKVISVTTENNKITLETTQANLEDVFRTAKIEFTTDLSNNSSKSSNTKFSSRKVNYLAKGVGLTNEGFEFDFSNTILYEAGDLKFEIKDGSAVFKPNFFFRGDYDFFEGLKFIDFSVKNSKLEIDTNLFLSASKGINLPKFSTTLADVDKKINLILGGVPVVIIINTVLVAELEANIDSSFDFTTGFINDYNLSTSAKYENGNWSGNFDLSPTLTSKPVDIKGEVNIAQNLTITPKVSLKFYGVIGPYCEPKVTEDFNFNISSPALDWDANLKAGLKITTGIDITIFSNKVADFKRLDSFEEVLWSAPENLEIVSGNNQEGVKGLNLSEPLKVKLTDLKGNSLKNLPVYFEITEGNGKLDNETVSTDDDGFAEAIWTLGNNTDSHTVEVSVKKANGTKLKDTPKSFTAISGEFNIFSDAQVAKVILEANGIDTSNANWESKEEGLILDLLTAHNFGVDYKENGFRISSFDLSNKDITNIPEELGNLTEVTYISLSHNSLTSLPESLGNLTKLITLDLEYNNLTSLPNSIGDLTVLRTLILNNNKLTSLPELIVNTNLSGIVNMNNNNLSSLPDEFGKLTQISKLKLDNNNLTSIPTSICDITELRALGLVNNNLTSIPASIGNLSQLTDLGLGANKLTSIPSTIGNLSELLRISLMENELTSLPDTMGNLNKLTEINVFYNNILSVPASLANIDNIQAFYFGYNPNLKCLPQAIWDLHEREANKISIHTSDTLIKGDGDVDCSE